MGRRSRDGLTGRKEAWRRMGRDKKTTTALPTYSNPSRSLRPLFPYEMLACLLGLRPPLQHPPFTFHPLPFGLPHAFVSKFSGLCEGQVKLEMRHAITGRRKLAMTAHGTFFALSTPGFFLRAWQGANFGGWRAPARMNLYQAGTSLVKRYFLQGRIAFGIDRPGQSLQPHR